MIRFKIFINFISYFQSKLLLASIGVVKGLSAVSLWQAEAGTVVMS